MLPQHVREHKDISGCMLERGHYEPHRCEVFDGKVLTWEDDFDCGCGDAHEDGDFCIVYRVADDDC